MHKQLSDFLNAVQSEVQLEYDTSLGYSEQLMSNYSLTLGFFEDSLVDYAEKKDCFLEYFDMTLAMCTPSTKGGSSFDWTRDERLQVFIEPYWQGLICILSGKLKNIPMDPTNGDVNVADNARKGFGVGVQWKDKLICDLLSRLPERLNDHRPLVRARCCKFISHLFTCFNDTTGFPLKHLDHLQTALLKRLNDTCRFVQRCACRAIKPFQSRSLKHNEVTNALLNLATRSLFSDLRIAAVDVLCIRQETLEVLVKLSAHDCCPNVRLSALKRLHKRVKLKQLSSKMRYELLISGLFDPEQDIRDFFIDSIVQDWLDVACGKFSDLLKYFQLLRNEDLLRMLIIRYVERIMNQRGETNLTHMTEFFERFLFTYGYELDSTTLADPSILESELKDSKCSTQISMDLTSSINKMRNSVIMFDRELRLPIIPTATVELVFLWSVLCQCCYNILWGNLFRGNKHMHYGQREKNSEAVLSECQETIKYCLSLIQPPTPYALWKHLEIHLVPQFESNESISDDSCTFILKYHLEVLLTFTKSSYVSSNHVFDGHKGILTQNYENLNVIPHLRIIYCLKDLIVMSSVPVSIYGTVSKILCRLYENDEQAYVACYVEMMNRILRQECMGKRDPTEVKEEEIAPDLNALSDFLKNNDKMAAGVSKTTLARCVNLTVEMLRNPCVRTFTPDMLIIQTDFILRCIQSDLPVLRNVAVEALVVLGNLKRPLDHLNFVLSILVTAISFDEPRVKVTAIAGLCDLIGRHNATIEQLNRSLSTKSVYSVPPL
ncbi:hypothetical protein ACOME3_009405 [Neoechinorhynchus agilis]